MKDNKINRATGPKIRATGFKPVALSKFTRRNLPHWEKAGATYFITFNTKRIELSEAERRLVMQTCLHWQDLKWRVHQLLVMPDHVHLLATPLPIRATDNRATGLKPVALFYSLSEILHSVKRYSAREINQRRGRQGTLWWDESYDMMVNTEEEFRQKWDYIRNNPVKKGLARRAEQYAFYWEEETKGHRFSTGEPQV